MQIRIKSQSRSLGLLVLFSTIIALFSVGQAQTIEIVRDFVRYPVRPKAPLIQGIDGYLYGTASQGGASEAGGLGGDGTLFRIAPDGSGFQIVKHFECGVPTNGCEPLAGVIQGMDGFLYGTTNRGGSTNQGVVFKIASNGTGFQILKSFSCMANEGCNPQSGLIQLSDGYLYGTTASSGVDLAGTIFRIAPDGSGFQVLKNFECGLLATNNGCNPLADLIQLSDGFLYGTTNLGGANHAGTVFRIAPNGAGFEILHSFQCGNNPANGCNPQAGLTELNGLLYGTTNAGGANNGGTVFKIAPNNTGFQVIKSFQCGQIPTNGCNPRAGLTPSNGLLYGTTSGGGANNAGTVFTITPDGLTFVVLKSFQFTASPTGGSQPQADLFQLADGHFYGTTFSGGVHDLGTVFKIAPDGSFALLLSGGCDLANGCNPVARLTKGADDNLYGVTLFGGENLQSDGGGGTVFKIAPAGNGFTQMRSFVPFGPGIASGNMPATGLIQLDDGFFYGITSAGGAFNAGLIFRINQDGSVFQGLRSLTAGQFLPHGELIQGRDGYLYGTRAGTGSVFKIRPDGTDFSEIKIFTCSVADSCDPRAGLIQGKGSDDFLYGTTRGSIGALGSIFKIGPDGTGFQLIKSFSCGTNDGCFPEANLIQGIDGFLYGTTFTGGAHNEGTIFKIGTDGTGFTILKSLECGVPDNGCLPFAELVQLADGYLYGTTRDGGAFNQGTVFKLLPDGSNFTIIDSFRCDGDDGCRPEAGLIQASNGYLYGTTTKGGYYGAGTIFRLSPDSTAPDTTLTSMPPNPSNSTSATFHFTSTEPNSAFACSLDGAVFTACSSPQTYNSLSEGTHSFSVRATDLTGNADTTPAAHQWTIDLTPPETTITTTPPNPSNSTNASFTFASNENNSVFQCNLDDGGVSACTTPQVYSNLTTGSHTFQVRAVDLAGNFDSTPASYAWMISPSDITPPDTTLTDTPPVLTSSTVATFTFTANEAGSTFACSLDGAAFTACNSPQAYSSLTDGNHTFHVRATDAANNTDPTPANYIWTINTETTDTTAPALGSFFVITPSVDASNGPIPVQVTLVAADNLSGISSVFVDLRSPSGLLRGSSCSRTSGTTLNGSYLCTSNLPQYSESGVWQFSVRLQDVVGNNVTITNAQLVARGFPATFTNTGTQDVTPPTLANFIVNTPTVDTTNAPATVQTTLTITDNLSGVGTPFVDLRGPSGQTRGGGCSMTGGTALNATYLCTSSLPQFSEGGVWQFSVRLSDVVGNNNTITNAQLVALGFPSTFTNTGQQDTMPPTLTNFVVNTPVVDTSEAAAIVQTTVTITDDLSGVGTPFVDLRSPSGLTRGGGCSITAGTATNATYVCISNLPQFSEQGIWQLSVRLSDRVGNNSTLSTAQLVALGFTATFLNTPAPDTSITATPPLATTDRFATFSFTSSEAGSTFECSLDGALFNVCSSPRTYSGLAVGNHSFQVRAKDAAGNTDPTPAAYAWTIETGTILNPQLGWAKRAGGLGFEQGMGIAVDNFGNTYLTGSFSDSATFGSGETNETTLVSGGNTDAYVAKYGSDGTLQWVKQAGGNGAEQGFGIVVDGGGNSYVTGVFQDHATFGSGEPNQTVLSSAGSNDVFIAKYDNAGLLLWAKQAGGNSLDFGRSIAIDGLGNTYVIGTFQGSSTFGNGELTEITIVAAGVAGVDDIFLAKYDTQGSILWATRAGGLNTDRGFGISVDSAGNSYVTGAFAASATFGQGGINQTTFNSLGAADIFVAKYDSSGSLLWARRAGGAGDDQGLGIATDSSGNSYVTGRFSGTATFGQGEVNQTIVVSTGTTDIFTAKYDANGSLAWLRASGGTGDDQGLGIAVDGSGKSYVTGQFTGIATFAAGDFNQTTLASVGGTDLFVAHYDSNGDFEWAVPFGGPNTDQVFGVAVDGGGNVHLTGHFSGTITFGLGDANETTLVGNGGTDLFIAKYTGNDSQPPDTIITQGPPPITNNPSATFTFSSTENAGTFACSLDGSAFAPCNNPQGYSGLSAGNHMFQVQATDSAGNTDPTPATHVWTVDLTAPNTTITSRPPATTNSTTASFTFVAAEQGSTFTCTIDNTAFGDCTSPISYTGLSAGSHRFSVRATDSAGNTDPTPAVYIWIIDLTAPDTAITSFPPSINNKKNVQFKFSSTEQGSFECSLDNLVFAPCTSPTNYSGLSQGGHIFRVRAIDRAGNTDPTPATHAWAQQ